jgi:site-specific DNA-methyltransferase (adenine-specific)
VEIVGKLPTTTGWQRWQPVLPRNKNARYFPLVRGARSREIHFAMTKFDLRLNDCALGMLRLPSRSVDLVVTSPPYNLGISYGKYSDQQDRQSYLRWCRKWAGQVRRILKSNGSFFLNIGSAPSNPMLPHQIAMKLTSAPDGFVLQNTIHWIKSITIEDRCSHRPVAGQTGTALQTGHRPVATNARSYGHFKPINSKRFLNDCHEYLFHFTKSGGVQLDRLALGVPYQDKSNVARWRHTRGSDLRCRGNTWFVPYETIQSRQKERPHPATFPVQLAEWCIKLHGPTGAGRVQTMLDPFLGIGNSAVAAQRCGVKKFIGFEIDETYLAEAKRRLESLR